MKKEDFQQIILFTVFFAVGTAGVTISFLGAELQQFYQGKEALQKHELFIQRLEQLNCDYEALLKQLHEDPDTVNRLAPAELGTEPQDSEKAAYPKIRIDQLTAAKKALIGKTSKEENFQQNRWFARCGKMPSRIALFIAGTCLIIISLVYFGPWTTRISVPEPILPQIPENSNNLIP